MNHDQQYRLGIMLAANEGKLSATPPNAISKRCAIYREMRSLRRQMQEA